LSKLSSHIVEEVIAVARKAGETTLAVYASDFGVQTKKDASPVTRADEEAEALIVAALRVLTPEIPIVCEEAATRGDLPDIGERFWLVDPLDGTKEFVSRNGEFTINIALIEGRKPALGVVLAPALGRLFAGVVGAMAIVEERGERGRIACRTPPAEGITVVSSRSHGDVAALKSFLGPRRVACSVSAGSSLKFCMVACGEADLYPRLGPTMEWDTAAGHAVLAAAGGRVVALNGPALAYGKQGFANPPFVAMGSGWPSEYGSVKSP